MPPIFTEVQLVAAARDQLAALGFAADWVVASVDSTRRWRVALRVNDREFVFGTHGPSGFCFCERHAGREEDFTAATLPPAAEQFEVVWPYAFTLLRQTLHDPRFRGFAGPVL